MQPIKPQAPLPWQHVKPATEDPTAPQRVQTILDSPSYRQADHDVDFLNHDATRGVRLQIDYLKPELALQAHNIQHAIVVFGSTRITEPATAQARVTALQQALRTDPQNTALQQALQQAERLLAKSHYYSVARELGQRVGTLQCNNTHGRVSIMTGGGPGIMEAANRGAFDMSAHSIGLNITLPHEQYPNPYITPTLCFRFHYFALRKLHFLLRACALVVFPGGYGTLDELFETLTLIQTRKIQPVPIVLVGQAYWQQAINFDFLVQEGVIAPEDTTLFWYAETADEIWQGILNWHKTNGSPLNGT